MPKIRRKLTAAQRMARRERKKNFTTIFVHGKQKRIRRSIEIDGQALEDVIADNADPIWLHQNEMWEYMDE